MAWFDISLEHLGTLFGGPPKKIGPLLFPHLPWSFLERPPKAEGTLWVEVCGIENQGKDLKGEKFVQVEILSFLRVGGENSNL